AEARPLIPPPPPAPPRRPRRAEAAASPSKPQAPDPFDPAEAEDETQGYAGAADRGLAARVELALRDDRVDFYLQPVVSLPNRRILHYEGFSRLREPDGLVLPEEFLPAAAAEGRLVEIDRRAIERAARVAHRLNARGRGVRIFVNIASETLADDRVARDVATYIDGSPELARLLVLELSQSAFDGLGALERENRDALAAKGVRFSIDQVSNLRLDGRDLAARGVRFVKVPAATLLDPDTARNLPVHPADLPNLLARDGVDLIATHVEEERTTPELLDLDVKAAQGFLFGVPRPVRGEGGESGETGSDGVTRAFTPHAFPRRA
ncbi:EAL domain-containing protein, partial [Methylopila sp. Yamaguchi]|uniref:EAL domain-containing protein n=1 Tax=Methylopila sp. Yamaguchi TaxID=1437817 RepID=UPI0011AEFAA6